jgi:hypothetical protein
VWPGDQILNKTCLPLDCDVTDDSPDVTDTTEGHLHSGIRRGLRRLLVFPRHRKMNAFHWRTLRVRRNIKRNRSSGCTHCRRSDDRHTCQWPPFELGNFGLASLVDDGRSRFHRPRGFQPMSTILASALPLKWMPMGGDDRPPSAVSHWNRSSLEKVDPLYQSSSD